MPNGIYCLMNNIYKRAVEVFNKLFWVGTSPFSDLFLFMHLNGIFQDPFEEEVKSLFYTKFPKRKKYDHSLLAEEEIKEIRNKWQKRAERFYSHKFRQYTLLEYWLQENAHRVLLVSDWQVCYRSEFSTYRSQTHAEAYTKANCKLVLEKLKEFSIPGEVRAFATVFEGGGVRHHLIQAGDGYSPHRYRFSQNDYDSDRASKHASGHCVYAPIAPYQLEAINRLTSAQETPLEWAVKCWKAGANPKVYNPFLDDEIYEKSMSIAFTVDK